MTETKHTTERHWSKIIMDETYLGKVNTKDEFFLKLEYIVEKDDYKVHKLCDRKGRKAMFYNYIGMNAVKELEVNDCILMKATIAGHREFQKEPYTYLNRVTVISNQGSKGK